MKPFFKNKNPYQFVRFGSLNLKKQEFYSSDKESFHKPPAKYGIYAMPYYMQELFLVGCIEKFQSEIFPTEPEYNDELSWSKYEEQCDKIKQQIRRVFQKKNGLIWHHLIEFVENPIEESGFWIKSSMKDWELALRKSIVKDRKDSLKLLKCKATELGTINGCFGLDKYEVFFDEKI